MTRRPVLPGASELFRRTDTTSVPEVTELPSLPTPASSPALRSAARRVGESPAEAAASLTLVPGGAQPADDDLAAFRAVPAEPAPAPVLQPRVATRGKPARRTERTKHDEKITVYISAEELLALESARLTLRAHHGVAADRGRIVREAVSVLLADLAERGEDAVLVRRLQG
ncbi:hypothetical protein E9549_14350 [Blastococcus sp. MG754426]|uniref:hypothetical protein n=1 Tax=unclassified Blastococcus TaxID=2619396 RepID=UPI001EF10F2C|nr:MULTISPECIES: hypothetical protein [unclassified Blastococcus]MCF6508577.1 hypothetical protein [Blastococcus sp. MG754426]MCF6513155.1 hypothetical protein [Blastococcus sp. MG754427]MCF6736005.1 hypothetical protein [Blastococcus sp. KM273129]